MYQSVTGGMMAFHAASQPANLSTDVVLVVVLINLWNALLHRVVNYIQTL